MRPLATVLCAAVLFTAAPAGAQDVEPAPPAEYESLVDGALVEFNAGRYAEARALFARAHSVYPNARTLRGLGLAEFELADYPAAVHDLGAALLETRRALTDEQRSQIEAVLARARVFVGRFVIPAVTGSARLFVDGERRELDGWPRLDGALHLAVGAHTVTIRNEAARSTSATIDVRGGEDRRLDIDLAPLTEERVQDHIQLQHDDTPRDAPSRPRRRRGGDDPAPWILAATGASIAIGGAVVLGAGLADLDSVQGARMGAEWGEIEPAHDRVPILTATGAILIGVGAALAGAGLVWAFTTGISDVAITPTSITIRGQL